MTRRDGTAAQADAGRDGNPVVCDHVWISYLTGKFDGSANGEGIGKLTCRFRCQRHNPTQDGGKIGPEFTFGLTLDKVSKQPVLIIKTAWRGRACTRISAAERRTVRTK